MPFSLINRPIEGHAGISSAINEIFPGWVLYGNYYMIIRNEDKFANRNKSSRNLFEMDILRAEIVAMMIRARHHLAFSPCSKRIYDVATFSFTDEETQTTVPLNEDCWEVPQGLIKYVYLDQDV